MESNQYHAPYNVGWKSSPRRFFVFLTWRPVENVFHLGIDCCNMENSSALLDGAGSRIFRAYSYICPLVHYNCPNAADCVVIISATPLSWLVSDLFQTLRGQLTFPGSLFTLRRVQSDIKRSHAIFTTGVIPVHNSHPRISSGPQILTAGPQSVAYISNIRKPPKKLAVG